MHIHILGICGTFMGSLAVLAKELGHEVSGCDANVYPPMSTQLEEQGITLMQGYDPDILQPAPDLVIVGNAMSRGNPCVEYVLNKGLKYVSGPQWLAQEVLQGRWVLAVSGTHGKTTTSSMLAWILDQAGMAPGYLIGGVPKDFAVSSRLGDTPFFVIEADEYDSAFFDKRSKFIHYQPRTLIINNLEFDHADIFDDLAAIQKQFHHLVRTIPSEGKIVLPAGVENIEAVIEMGCWTELAHFSTEEATNKKAEWQTEWQIKLLKEDGSHFEVLHLIEGKSESQGIVQWNNTGAHNVANALAAIAAAQHVGVTPQHAIEALNNFSGIKRRMELIFNQNNIKIYDDFAHHPTAIETTLKGLRQQVGSEKIIAVIEPRSNTMRMGVHREHLVGCTKEASEVIWYQPENVDWDLQTIVDASEVSAKVCSSIDEIVEGLSGEVSPVHIVVMSNGGFGGVHRRLVEIFSAV